MGANLSYALYMVGQQVLLQPDAAARASRLPNGHGEALARLAAKPASLPLELTPATTLCALGPVVALALGCYAAATEWPGAFAANADAPPALWLAADCALALALNLLQLAIVARLSAFAYTVAGYVKGVLVVALACLAFREAIPRVVLESYALMVAGCALWTRRKLRARAAAAAPAAK